MQPIFYDGAVYETPAAIGQNKFDYTVKSNKGVVNTVFIDTNIASDNGDNIQILVDGVTVYECNKRPSELNTGAQTRNYLIPNVAINAKENSVISIIYYRNTASLIRLYVGFLYNLPQDNKYTFIDAVAAQIGVGSTITQYQVKQNRGKLRGFAVVRNDGVQNGSNISIDVNGVKVLQQVDIRSLIRSNNVTSQVPVIFDLNENPGSSITIDATHGGGPSSQYTYVMFLYA